jgi:hypothetical protein
MIDPAQLAICRQRGHEGTALISDRWCQCKWCGTWVRSVRAIEEREDEPPKDQQWNPHRPA